MLTETLNRVPGSDDEAPHPSPGRDNEGFVDLEQLRARVAELSLEQFVDVFRAPALVTVSIDSDPRRGDETLTPQTGMRVASLRKTIVALPSQSGLATDSRTLSRYHRRVAFLSKRPGNNFPNMISLGRAMNNDVAFILDTVSKFHGYFIHYGADWSFTDQRSSNGTFLNGERLEHGVTHPLADGDRLTFGVNAVTRFFLPASLYAYLRESSP